MTLNSGNSGGNTGDRSGDSVHDSGARSGDPARNPGAQRLPTPSGDIARRLDIVASVDLLGNVSVRVTQTSPVVDVVGSFTIDGRTWRKLAGKARDVGRISLDVPGASERVTVIGTMVTDSRLRSDT